MWLASQFKFLTPNLLKVSQATIWQVVGKIVTASTTLVVLGLISRQYGNEGLGIFTLTIAYLSFFYLAADLGFNATALLSLDKTPEIASRLLSFRLVWSLGLVILANLLAQVLPLGSRLFSESVLIGSATILFSSFSLTTNLIFQSKLRFDQSVIASVISSLYTIPVFIYLISLGVEVKYLLLAPLSGWVVNSIIAFTLVRKFYQFQFLKPDLSYIKSLLKDNWPIALTLLLNVVYFRLDAFILTSIKGVAEVGIYNLSYQIFQTLLVIPTFIMNGFYPLLVADFKESFQKFSTNLIKAAFGLFFLSFAGTILTLVLAPAVILILAGESFSASAQVLQMLSLSFPAFFVSSVLMWTMLILRKQKIMAGIYSLGLIVNIILNLILIPHYSYMGAAVVTVISEYLILGLQIAVLLPILLRSRQSSV